MLHTQRPFDIMTWGFQNCQMSFIIVSVSNSEIPSPVTEVESVSLKMIREITQDDAPSSRCFPEQQDGKQSSTMACLFVFCLGIPSLKFFCHHSVLFHLMLEFSYSLILSYFCSLLSRITKKYLFLHISFPSRTSGNLQ